MHVTVHRAVAETNDVNVVRNVHAKFSRRFVHPEGNGKRDRKDEFGPLGRLDQIHHPAIAILCAEPADNHPLRFDDEMMVAHSILKSLLSAPSNVHMLKPGEMGYALIPHFSSVRNCLICAAMIVDGYSAEVGWTGLGNPVHKNERYTRIANCEERRQVLRLLRYGNEDSVHPHGDERFDVFSLPYRVLLRHHQDDLLIVFESRVIHLLDDRPEKRVGDLWNDESKSLGTTGGKIAGKNVRRIPQFRRDTLDLCDRPVGNIRVAPKRLRDRYAGDFEPARYVIKSDVSLSGHSRGSCDVDGWCGPCKYIPLLSHNRPKGFPCAVPHEFTWPGFG